MTDLFLSCLEISISAGFVAAGLLVLSNALGRRYAAKWKRGIWIFLALWLILPIGVGLGRAVADGLVQKGASVYGEALSDTLTEGVLQPLQINVEIPVMMTEPVEIPFSENHMSLSILDIAAIVWAIGSLLFLGMHLAGYLCYRRNILKQGNTVSEKNLGERVILDMVSELKQELRIRRAVQVMESQEASSPMLIGFLKPFLILPKEQYNEKELYFILKHELTHLKCGDIYFKFLFVAANAVHWFNPVIWIMQKEADVDLEIACDEHITRGADYSVRKEYTETLLSAIHRQCGKSTVLSTQFYGGTAIMKKRFTNILSGKERKKGILIGLCVMLLTVGLGVLSVCSVGKAGQGERLSDEELCRLAGEYYARHHDGFVPEMIEVDSVNTAGQVIIHLYENAESGMGMTYEWYTVDPVTGIGETLLFDEINLLEEN